MKHSLTQLTVGFGIAIGAALVPAGSQATVISQSILKIDDLTFRIADGASGRSASLLSPSNFSNINGTQSGDVKAALNGAQSIKDFNLPFAFAPVSANISVCEGSGCGSYTPGTDLGDLPATMSVASSTAKLDGYALGDGGLNGPLGVDLLLDNTVSIVGDGIGTAQGNVGLSASFNFDLVGGIAGLEIYFTASQIFNQLIDKEGESAEAKPYSFTVSLRKLGSPTTTAINWAPSDLNLPANNVDDPDFNSKLGFTNQVFEYESGALGVGRYQLTLAAANAVDGEAIPEPATLALLSIGLLGVGAAARRRQA